MEKEKDRFDEPVDKLPFLEASHRPEEFQKEPGDFLILFKGNSITAHGFSRESVEKLGWDHLSGMAASSAERDYVHLFSGLVQQTMPGRRVRILIGQGGRPGLVLSHLEPERRLDPDLVIVQNGEHCAHVPLLDEFRRDHPLLLNTLKELYPRARIFSVGVWNPRCREEFIEAAGADYAASARQIEEIQRCSAAAAGIPFVPVSGFENDPANSGSGKVAPVRWHPNDNGMRCYAESLFNAFLDHRSARSSRPQ